MADTGDHQREHPLLGAVPALAGVRIRGIVDATGWWLLSQPDADDLDEEHPGTWRREPVAAWALVDDGKAAPFVAGLSAAGLDVVELAPHPARYVHEASFPACACPRPLVLTADAFCATCAGTLGVRSHAAA